ncbi:MAG TPA: DUF4386 domain-containing protein [Egibacteraceae bacterium]
MTTVRAISGRLAADPARRTAFAAGVLYLITFVAGIPPTLFLYGDLLSDPAVIVDAAGGTAVLVGGLLEVGNALACIGTAVVLFPVVRRQHEAAALGFVTTRLLEAAIILTGVVSLLSVVTLRQGPLGADPAALAATAGALVAIHGWTDLFGPGLMPVFNALLLGSLLYRSALVPRAIPLLGLLGAPLLLASTVASVLGANEQVSPLSALAVAPIFFWELSLGVYLTVKGFTPTSPLLAGGAPASAPATSTSTVG